MELTNEESINLVNLDRKSDLSLQSDLSIANSSEATRATQQKNVNININNKI
jgi:hypothetical protein